MEEYRAKILIVDDDQSFGKALVKVLEKEDFSVTLCRSSVEALNEFQNNQYQAVITDILLSGMTGVELVEKMKNQAKSGMPLIILMSGVFTDRSFVKEALNKTQAKEFFKKPFETADLLKILDAQFEKPVISPQKLLNSLLAKQDVPDRKKRRVIEALEEVSGFDLPFILSILVETNTSGHLNIVEGEGLVSGITLSNGSIVSMDSPEKETLLGQILIEKGYITPVELEQALGMSRPKRIGERLIHANFLSPHAFTLALEEQMNIRLSRRVKSGLIEVNFAPCEVEESEVRITPDEFLKYLHDWIVSKLSFEWLRSFYRFWESHKIVKGPQFESEHAIFSLPLLKRVPEFVGFITSGVTLGEVLNSDSYDNHLSIRAIHLLLLKRVICIDEAISKENEMQIISRLEQIWEDMQDKGHFEVIEMMSVNKNAKKQELERAFQDFRQIVDYSSHANEQLQEMSRNIMVRANQAYNLLIDPESKEEYKKQVEGVLMKKKVEARNAFEEAKKQIKKGQGKEALKLLSQVEEVDPQYVELRIHIAWAKVLCFPQSTRKAQLLKEVDVDILAIPPEEKQSSVYAYVQGLYQKTLGNKPAAERHLKKAIYLDPGFVEAKRELNVLSIQNKGKGKRKDKSGDAKGFFGGFFKKKNKSA